MSESFGLGPSIAHRHSSSPSCSLCHLCHIRVQYNNLYARSDFYNFANNRLNNPLTPLRLHLRTGMLDPNGLVWRLNLDLISLPLVLPNKQKSPTKYRCVVPT